MESVFGDYPAIWQPHYPGEQPTSMSLSGELLHCWALGTALKLGNILGR